MWVCDEVLHVLYEVPEAGRFVPFSSCTILGSSGLFQLPCVLSYFPVARLYRRRLSIRPWYVGFNNGLLWFLLKYCANLVLLV